MPRPGHAPDRPGGAVRRVAGMLRDADWRVWADLPDRDHRRPSAVAGDRYDWIPALYAEHGRTRRLVSVAPLGGTAEPARRRAFAAAAREWAPHGSYVRLVATSMGRPAAARHVVEPAAPPDPDPLRELGATALGTAAEPAGARR